MITKKSWKRSVSMFLACSMVLGSSVDFQTGNVTLGVANVQAKEMSEDGVETELSTAGEESKEAGDGQNLENTAEDEENKSEQEEYRNIPVNLQ